MRNPFAATGLRLACRPVLESLEGRQLLSTVDVLTQHNDLSRTGANLNETDLKVSNVNQNAFGRLYSRTVDDQVYAQPLVASGVTVKGARHNLLIVATVNDTVYAYDADNPGVTTPYWQASMLTTSHGAAGGARAVHHDEVGQNCGNYKDFSGNIGIVGTPVIDKASSTIYLVSRSVENGKFVQRLHALDLASGNEKLGGPTVITASVNGTGSGSTNGQLPFDPKTQNQRPALALTGGNVIIGWASHCDTGPYHGWVMGYDAKTLKQNWTFVTTPNGGNGGVWMSGAAPTVDSQGNVYFTSGNGSVDVSRKNYGGGVFKLSPTGQLLDYFIPSNYQHTNDIDADFGATGLLLVPGTNTLITGDKQGKFFVLDNKNLTKLNSSDKILQEFQVTPNVNNDHIHGSPVYYKDAGNNQWVYVWGMNDKLKQFKFNGDRLASTSPTYTSNVTLAPTPSQPGGLMSVSSDGNKSGTGVIWAMSTLGPSANQAVRPGIIRAFDASNVSRELWNSEQNADRDEFGNLAKFSYPTVSGGHVFVPTFSNQVVVYGLLAGVPAKPASLTAISVTGKNQINLKWAGVSGATNYVIERRSSGSTFEPLAFVGAGQTTYSDTDINGGTNYAYRVRARNATGDGAPVTASAAAAFTQKLVARWGFNDKSSGTGGNVADLSGNGNTGVAGSNAAYTAGGQLAQAINFTASENNNAYRNSYVKINSNDSLNPASQITVAAWIKVVDWDGNRRILQKGLGDNQYRLLDENNALSFDIAGVGNATYDRLPSTGNWHHVAGTYDGGTVRLFLDGKQVAAVNGSGNIPVSNDPVYIGAKSQNDVAGDHMNGAIDDVRLYNYALDSSDINALYANSTPSAPTGLSVAAASQSTINLKWTDNSGIESAYLIERRTGNGAFSVIASVDANTVAFTDINLTANTTYGYRVRAVNAVDPSAYTAIASATTASSIINALVGRWQFNETTGTTASDSSGYNNTGTRVGATRVSSDTPDGSAHSINLNSGGQLVQIKDSPELQPTDAITLAAWVKADSWSRTRGIISKGNREGAYYLIADQGKLVFNLSGQGTLYANLPGTGSWHEFTGTYDGSTMKLYIDSKLVASQKATGQLLTSSDPLFIGGTGASASTGTSFDGKIDDARIYNYALPPQDVSQNFGDIANYTFSESSGTKVADSSPNKNDITLVNGPTRTTGTSGGGVKFNGSTQYGVAENNQTLNPTGAITLVADIKADTFANYRRIIQKGNGTTSNDVQYALKTALGRLEFQLGGITYLSVAAPSTGVWHRIVGTYDGSTMTIYIDGKKAGSKSASGSMMTSTENLYLAAAGGNDNPNKYFKGSIDNVRILGRSLTASEVATLA